MNQTDELILKMVHEAQQDAGSFKHFKGEVEIAGGYMPNGVDVDPVAAFIAALIRKNNPATDDFQNDLMFYGSEIERIVQTFKQLEDE